MARKYQVNGTVRFVNRVMVRMIHWNICSAGNLRVDCARAKNWQVLFPAGQTGRTGWDALVGRTLWGSQLGQECPRFR